MSDRDEHGLQELDFQRAGFGTFYDELPLWSAPFGLMMLERVPLRSGMAILDVGAGTGFLSLELAQRCGPCSTVFAVDPWEAGNQRLREKLAYLGIDNVRVLGGDAAQLDLPDASIDLVVSNLGINNFENPDAVLARCQRVLRPGASLALTTNVTGHMQEFYDVYRAVLEEGGAAELLPAFDEHVQHRGTVDSVKTLLERAGFEIAEVVEDSFQMRFADGVSLLRHVLIRLGFLPAWKTLAPQARIDETFSALETKLNELADRRGALSLTIPVVYVEARKT